MLNTKFDSIISQTQTAVMELREQNILIPKSTETHQGKLQGRLAEILKKLNLQHPHRDEPMGKAPRQE